MTTGIREARSILSRRGLQFSLLVALIVIVASAGLETAVESHAHGSNIHGFGDAMWWAIVTVTTVGYGDKFQVTTAGRGIAVALMLTGIAVFCAVTASIAAYFVDTDREPDPQLVEINARLARIEAMLSARR